MSMIFCRGCGKEIHETALTCPHCGAPQAKASSGFGKKQGTAFLFAFFLGGLGGHRFYLGNIGLGILYLFTLGLLGIGTLVDLINLAFMRPEVFAAKYNNGAVDKPIGAWAKGLVLIFPLIIVMGIGSSFYNGYKQRHPSTKPIATEMPQPASGAQPNQEQATPSIQPQQVTTVEQAGLCKGLDLSVTPDQLECADREFTNADKQLNGTYKQLMASLDSSQKANLKKEQIAWVKEKETKCAQEGEEAGGGQLGTVVTANCNVHMTEQRLAYLQNYK